MTAPCFEKSYTLELNYAEDNHKKPPPPPPLIIFIQLFFLVYVRTSYNYYTIYNSKGYFYIYFIYWFIKAIYYFALFFT